MRAILTACAMVWGASLYEASGAGQPVSHTRTTLTDAQIKHIEEKIGFVFTNKDLLRQALTHKSISGGKDFDKLELLGDKVLGAALAVLLYAGSASAEELHKSMQARANNATLADIMVRSGLGAYITANRTVPSMGNGSVESDTMEALLGAVMQDRGDKSDAADRFRGVVEAVRKIVLTEHAVAITPPVSQVQSPAALGAAVSQAAKAPEYKLSQKELSSLRQEAEQGNAKPEDVLKLARHYIAKESFQEAFKWLEKCGDNGEAYYEKAKLLRQGEDGCAPTAKNRMTPEGCEQRAKWLMVLAGEKGVVAGMYDAWCKHRDDWIKYRETPQDYWESNIKLRCLNKNAELLLKALGYLSSAVKNGDAKAKAGFEDLLRQAMGQNSFDDLEKYRIFKAAAESGNAQAYYHAAEMLSNRKIQVTTTDAAKEDITLKEALRFYTKASELGHAESVFKTALCHEEGKGTAQSADEALKYYSKAADAGNVEAHYKVAQLFEKRIPNNPANTEKAREWYYRAHKKGHAGASAKYFEMQLKAGIPVDAYEVTNSAGAMAGILNLAASGNTAENTAAQFLIATVKATQGNDVEAFRWFSKAAAAKHGEAQYRLARAYRYGMGCEIDLDKAKGHYKSAAEQNILPAMFELAQGYDFGFEATARAKKEERRKELSLLSVSNSYYSDVSRKLESYRSKARELTRGSSSSYGNNQEREALPWYQKCAQMGHADALYHLGEYHALGKGSLPRSYAEVVKYWHPAVAAGHAGTKTALACAIQKGHLISKDPVAVVKYLQEAADAGDSHALYNLAQLYDAGTGGAAKDPAKALASIDKALALLEAEVAMLA